MRSTLAMLTGLFLLTSLGCSTTPTEPPQSARLTFAAERYPAVFEAAVETLRDHGYRIARRDYRFGTITTYPKEAATAAEFWVDDATTPQQRQADTLNSQQRTVTVKVEQPDAEQGYALTVEVLVQRLQRPDRYLTHSASPRISRTYTNVPTHLKDRGIDGPYAQTLSRDPLLERRLIEAIKAVAVGDLSATDKAVDSAGPAESMISEMRLEMARALIEDARNAGLKDRQNLLGKANDLLEEVAKGNPDRLQLQIEYAEGLLELASHDPLTNRQRATDKELVTLDRFQREKHFINLFDLIDRLIKGHPDDSEVIDLKTRTQAAIAVFKGIQTSN